MYIIDLPHHFLFFMFPWGASHELEAEALPKASRQAGSHTFAAFCYQNIILLIIAIERDFALDHSTFEH